MRTLILGRVGLLLLASGLLHTAQAQSLLGDRGSSCVTIAAGGGTHVIALSGAIPAGATALIAAGTTGNATLTGVVDSSGTNLWTPVNSVAPSFRSFSVHGRITSALSAGQTVTLSYSAAPPAGQTSCASIVAFSGVASLPVDKTGSGSGTSNAQSVTLAGATTQQRALLHVAFALGGVPNGIGVPPPANPLQFACAAGNSFCVIHGWRLVTAPGIYSMSATTGSSIPWAGVITAYFSDILFADGFDP